MPVMTMITTITAMTMQRLHRRRASTSMATITDMLTGMGMGMVIRTDMATAITTMAAATRRG